MKRIVLSLAVASSLMVQNSSADINDGLVAHYEFEEHQYSLYNQDLSWTDSKIFCEERNSHLATITSENEYNFIIKNILPQSNAEYLWLGGTDEQNEGNWKWITGEKWDYTNWGNNQPDNANNEDYLEIYNYSGHIGYINDIPNNSQNRHHNIICENSKTNLKLNIKKGWNLVAVDANLSSIPNDVKIIWQYSKDNNWSAYSLDENIKTKIQNEGYKLIDTNLSSNDGTWFYTNKDTNISIAKPINDISQKPKYPNIYNSLGWSLKGTNKKYPANVFKCLDGKVDTIWKYKNNDWKLYIPNIDTSLYSSMFNDIEVNEGFWVNCK